MRTVNRALRRRLSDAELRALEGERVTDRHYDAVVAEDLDAYDADTARLIFRFRRGVLPAASTSLAREVFGDIDERLPPSCSRMAAAGRLDLARVRALRDDVAAVHSHPKCPFKGQWELRSGKRLESSLCNPVKSFIAGYNFRRFSKLARLGGFSAAFPGDWERAVPFFEAIGDALDRHMFCEARSMRRWCERHSVTSFTIGRTCLSTVAVNVSYDSCFHWDRGDMRDGYSTLTAVGVGGSYSGGYLVLPGYRVAVDVREGDVLFNQSHIDLHGNTAVRPDAPGAKRVSFVTYLKEMLRHAANKT
jgi:hypothetical protein